MDWSLKDMENNSFVGLIPWPVAAATAAWFGVMAYKAGKSVVLWAIGGGLLGLVVTTIILGLGAGHVYTVRLAGRWPLSA